MEGFLMSGELLSGPLGRRGFLRAAGIGAAAVGAIPLLGSCGVKGNATTSSDVLKIGLVSPQTGGLSSFAASDKYVVQLVQEALRNGFTAGGKKRKIEIVVKDTQSSPTRATEVTKELISKDGVDLIVASSTPDTANPVADQCELDGIPNTTTIVPWQSWFYGRGKKPGDSGFRYGTNFYSGMFEFADAYVAMMDRLDLDSNKIAALWPNDTDGNAFREGIGPYFTEKGYRVVDGGPFQNGTSDYAAMINRFKSEGADYFNGIPIPPDMQTFWKQAASLNYRPKFATIAKSMLFPSEAEALGPLATNLAVCVWWADTLPYTSSIDGTSAADLAKGYSTSTGNQWSQALGSLYSLFEVALEAFKAADDPKDRDDVADKLKNLRYQGISGPLDFTSGPEEGTAIIKCVGGQWRPGKDNPYEIVVVDNTPNPEFPVGGDLKPLNA
jgi:branched-chain amino acid transport system substrate-binding protein